MALTTTLAITVYGGVTPEPIDVTLYKGGTLIFSDSCKGTSTIPFNDLDSNIYTLFINGRNPLTPGGEANPTAATKCELSTDNISIMPTSDPNPDIEHDAHYLVKFVFTV